MSIVIKKIIIAIISVIIIGVGFCFILKYIFLDESDVRESAAACGLSLLDGEILNIRQGTVGSFAGIRIGLKSVQDDVAYIQFWDNKSDIAEPTSDLRACESANFGGYIFYIVNIIDRPNRFFGRPGSGNDSVDIFVRSS